MTETPTSSTASAHFCRRCGHPVSRVSHCQRCGAGVPRDGAAPPRPFFGWCERCGHDLIRDAAFCGGCGKPVPQATPPPLPERQRDDPTDVPPPLPPRPVRTGPDGKSNDGASRSGVNGAKQQTGSGCLLLLVIGAVVAGVTYWNRHSVHPPQRIRTPVTATPGLPVPRGSDAGPVASITNPRPAFNLLAPDGRVGVRVTANCRVPGGGRARLVAYVMEYPSARPVQTIYQDFGGLPAGADCSLVIPYEPLHPVPVDNSFYLVLAIEDASGRELARADRLRVDYKQGVSAVTRVRVFPGATDAGGRRGMRFTTDFIYGALYGRRCSVLLYFKDPATGKPLRSRDRNSADRNGNLVVWNERTISQSQRTEHKGIDLVLPADAVPAGVQRMRAEAVLWDPENKQYLSEVVPFDLELPDGGQW